MEEIEDILSGLKNRGEEVPSCKNNCSVIQEMLDLSDKEEQKILEKRNPNILDDIVSNKFMRIWYHITKLWK